MTKQNPTPKAPSARIDWLIGRVLQGAHEIVITAAHTVRKDEARRQRLCLLLVEGNDPIALALYEDCRRSGMTGPAQLKPYMVTTLLEPFAPLMEVAARHYATDGHVEAPLHTDEVRAVVLTLGTLTVVRLGPDAAPRHASSSYRPLRPDVLCAATACWRSDQPEGLVLHAVFETRLQGERFLAGYQTALAAIVACAPRPEAIEEELLRFKPVYGGREIPIDVQARTYALVGWLEVAGLLPEDPFNGLSFIYGCGMDLYESGELARRLGGPSDDLS